MVVLETMYLSTAPVQNLTTIILLKRWEGLSCRQVFGLPHFLGHFTYHYWILPSWLSRGQALIFSNNFGDLSVKPRPLSFFLPTYLPQHLKLEFMRFFYVWKSYTATFRALSSQRLLRTCLLQIFRQKDVKANPEHTQKTSLVSASSFRERQNLHGENCLLEFNN